MLFGPLLAFEWVRSARHRRHVLLRSLYALGLLVLLCGTALQRGGSGSPTEMAWVADSFFHTFMWVQLLLVLLLTPAYAAGAIAEEKSRKTLEFLLATDLSNQEIVLDKLAVRLASLTLLLLTGLPILSLTQFWGGVDPNLLLAGFAATGVTLLSLGAVSILSSVYARKPWDALVLAYGVVAAYLGLSTLGQELLTLPLAQTALPFPSPALTVGDLLAGFSAGNLFLALSQLGDAVALNRPLAEILPGIVFQYGLFHGLTAAVCLTWAVLRLRPVALKQIFPHARRFADRWRLFRRPGIGDRPLLWKEIFVEGSFHFRWPGRLLVAILVLASLVPVGFILKDWFHDVFGQGIVRPASHAETVQVNEWVRLVGTSVACLLLLGVALRAANSISGERDKQTLDSLLTTPLETKAILSAKWYGSLLSVRWGWLWLGSIWLVGVASGGLHPLAVPLLLGAWKVYADVVIGIGLRFSLVSRTTLRAVVGTLLTVVGVWVGHFLLLGFCCLPLLLAGLPAPLTLGLLAFYDDDFGRFQHAGLLLLGILVVGLACWELIAWSLWGRLQVRFGQTFLRQPPRPLPHGSRSRPPARPINAVLISEERLDDRPPTGLE